MQDITEEVFLLTKHPYRDSDYIAHFLSKEQGLLQAVVHGGKRMNRGGSFPYEPGDHLELHYREIENKDFIKLQDVNLLQSAKLDRSDYPTLLLSSMILEMVQKATHPNANAAELFQLLQDHLTLYRTEENAIGFTIKAILILLAYHGVGLDYSSCNLCNAKAWKFAESGEIQFRKETYHLDLQRGGMTCSSCGQSGHSGQTGQINAAMIKALLLVHQSWDYSKSNDFIPKEYLLPWLPLLMPLLHRAMQFRLKSQSMVEACFKISL